MIGPTTPSIPIESTSRYASHAAIQLIAAHMTELAKMPSHLKFRLILKDGFDDSSNYDYKLERDWNNNSPFVLQVDCISSCGNLSLLYAV